MITEPGIYSLSDAEYHADPCEVPSLSSSIARRLLTRSPAHAADAHPRLNPEHQPEHSTKFDLGTAAHDALLRGKTEDHFAIVDAGDWRKTDSKAKRADAYLAGKTPLLVDQWKQVEAMVGAARSQIEMLDRPERFDLDGALIEQTIVWVEQVDLAPDQVLEPVDGDQLPAWCRMKADVARPDQCFAWDYKTTKGSAHPDKFQRTGFDLGYDIQRGFYLRGLNNRLGDGGQQWELEFIVQELAPPYRLVPISFKPAATDLAGLKVERAIETWACCMHDKAWPAYPRQTVYIDAPPWLWAAWEERELREGRQ